MDIVNEFSTIFSTFGKSIAEALPNVLAAIVILIIGWLVAKIISSIVKKVLRTLRSDVVVDKMKEVDMFKSIDVNVPETAAKFTYWGIFFIFLIMATEKLGLNNVSEGISSLLGYLPRIISALIFFIIGTWFASLIKTVIATAAESMNIGVGKLIASFVFYFLVIMISITALNQAGINTDIITGNLQIILICALAALGLGYGLASKDLMTNLMGGFYAKEKFSIGQTITIGNTTGEIVKMDSTSVIVRNDQGTVVIPLGKLMNDEVRIS